MVKFFARQERSRLALQAIYAENTGVAQELAKLLDEHQSDLTKLSQSLLDGKSEAFVAELTKLLTTIATGIPALGALAKQGVAKAFALSTQAELERELARLADEEQKREFAELVAGPVEELIGQALIQLVRVHNRDTDSIVQELGGLREEFQAFRTDFAQRLEPETVVVDQIDVGEGVGVIIKRDATSRLRAGKIKVKKGTGLVLS
ncbi:hypothetical protein PPSIR1_38294 [Plesiocystis pacifica SIR-1]|uniref:Uncharacterized protein n=1 Tax=Plesiocystis pacifica SIR-1 TaxID=391625 RepID=A6GBT8_9BACT|nr:hypothetical protein [Plesiocystis pacifica]EDM76705.1 hypothetical protein PPSIR1_38294 [Plesiocystis pacifica SIR-1]